MTQINFFKESIKNLKTVGALVRTGKFACQGMTKHIDFDKASVIVELGAGDGVITKHILADMRPDAKLLSFEVNELFCKKLRTIDDPRLMVIEDSAENLFEYLDQIGATHVDFVVSAIPFVALPDTLGRDIISKCHDALRQGGAFIQINYSLLAKKLYTNIFGNIDINFIPLNIPPAFILVCQKQ